MLSNNTTITVRDIEGNEIIIQVGDISRYNINKSTLLDLTISEILYIAESKLTKQYPLDHPVQRKEELPRHGFVYNKKVLNPNIKLSEIIDKTDNTFNYTRFSSKFYDNYEKEVFQKSMNQNTWPTSPQLPKQKNTALSWPKIGAVIKTALWWIGVSIITLGMYHIYQCCRRDDAVDDNQHLSNKSAHTVDADEDESLNPLSTSYTSFNPPKKALSPPPATDLNSRHNGRDIVNHGNIEPDDQEKILTVLNGHSNTAEQPVQSNNDSFKFKSILFNNEWQSLEKRSDNKELDTVNEDTTFDQDEENQNNSMELDVSYFCEVH